MTLRSRLQNGPPGPFCLIAHQNTLVSLIMNTSYFFDRQQEFVGTSGLVIFGEDRVLSYLRDGNTDSYPHCVDLAGGGREADESPYDTFNRELREEFDLSVSPEQIVYALRGPSLISPARMGWFVVAKLQVTAAEQINFGNEGSGYQITSLQELLASPLLIPQRKQKIQEYLSITSKITNIV